MSVTFQDFCDAFTGSYADKFSYEGKQALFDYLEMLERDMDKEIELDFIALSCDFTEYDSAWDAMKQYKPEDMPVEGEEGDDLPTIQIKNEKAAADWLADRTVLIEVPGKGVIIQNF